MSLPGRHSLLWRLAGALALFCLLLVSVHVDMERMLSDATSYLPESTQKLLRDYAREAEAAWQEKGALGVDSFLQELQEREQIWAVVVDENKQSLSTLPLTAKEVAQLDFLRKLDFPVGRRGSTPTYYVPFVEGGQRLVMELPERLHPRRYNEIWEVLLQLVLPALLAVVVAMLLYRLLIAPLALLRNQAAALSAGNLSARLGVRVSQRKDELGELARTFNHMAERLEGTVGFQRQLLRDLSHELRTPLSRLRVAGEGEQDADALRQRLAREVEEMETLVANALELVWLDTERPSLALEEVDIVRLWDVLRENAGFETGWPLERMPCDLPPDCRVLGHLNGLARALENILRNAIRHSPGDGVVRLSGHHEEGHWLLWIDDQGPGVAEHELERIFLPFTRLSAARPGGDGFGLGLAIARSMISLQGGALWAEALKPGLRLKMRLKSV